VRTAAYDLLVAWYVERPVCVRRNGWSGSIAPIRPALSTWLFPAGNALSTNFQIAVSRPKLTDLSGPYYHRTYGQACDTLPQ